MFDSLSDQMRHDELHGRTMRERWAEWSLITAATALVCIGAYFAIRFLG